jgi:8-oxo-dGTP pyrophosphatase MutT (NUDIX family)
MTPLEIRECLGAKRPSNDRGDVVTGQSLLANESLEEFKDEGYGPIPSSGIPHDRGAGAVGVKIKRTYAGVLVPLIDRPGGLTVLLTRRTDDMNKHPGQVAFPGGRVDDGDADAVAAALREAHEEVGISPDLVNVLGRLDPYLTITGFEVLPVVGLVSPPPVFVPEPTEVAAIFEVPLHFLLNPANHQKVRRKVNGHDHAYYAMSYESHYIWGATAGMIVNLYEVLSD